MFDWHSPEELARDGAIFVNLVHALFGLYIWEVALMINYDWSYITRKRRFRWPAAFYFAGRYCLLFSLIGIMIGMNTRTEIDCQSLFTFNQLSGMASVGFASINLSIRTMAVWMMNKYVVALLVLVILGHWSLILQGALLETTWTPQGCQITHASTPVLIATFIYSMCFDGLVLALMAWRLTSDNLGPACDKVRTLEDGVKFEPETITKPGRLRKLIFGDGLIYFIIAFLFNLLATTFMLLNFNSVMSIIFNIPAAISSTIAACRVVRRLTAFVAREPLSAEFPSQPMAFRPPSVFVISVEEPVNSETHPEGIEMDTVSVNQEDLELEAYGGFGQKKKRFSGRSSVSSRSSVMHAEGDKNKDVSPPPS